MIIPLLLIVAVGFASCGDKEPEEKYPLEIPFKEYSFQDTTCLRTDIIYDSCANDKIIIINSGEEFENYIGCPKEIYSDIDLSKQTLLLTGGWTGGVHKIEKKLEQLSTDEYQLNVEITLNDAAVIESWNLSLITKKLNQGSKVELNVTIIKD
jgi:hypothetical protein